MSNKLLNIIITLLTLIILYLGFYLSSSAPLGRDKIMVYGRGGEKVILPLQAKIYYPPLP
jgi:hypothetical protein